MKNKKERKPKSNAGKRPLTDFIPKILTGKEDEMDRMLKSAFGDKDFSAEIQAERKKNATYWLLCAGLLAVLALAVLAQLAGGGNTPLRTFARPEAFEKPIQLAATVKAEYDSASVKKKVQMLVQPQNADETEIKRRIGLTAARLAEMIAGENESLDAVSTDLHLPERDEETQVQISWNSDRPEILDDGGALNGVRSAEGDRVTLKARLSLEDVSEVVDLQITLAGTDPESRLAKDLDAVLSDEVEQLNRSATGKSLLLPERDLYGVQYTWETGERRTYLLEIAVLFLFAFVLFKSRYKGIEKRILTARKSMMRDFPEFVNKLLLLLNAGLVVSTAVKRIAQDYEAHKEEGRPRPLYEELSGIGRRMENTNTSLTAELSLMAARSGIREMTRFASVVCDNLDKGSALAEKLHAESDLAWNMRRKNAEEAGRVAETKLVMPMALILLVIILITIAPAALEM
ncbi:MAG: type II secretion system F family protein [Clostridiales Family XIII bacterium]|jgi:hypothetical protein|nr:type II secretion system F family protein [Clostridiales Family XIII bacterium]